MHSGKPCVSSSEIPSLVHLITFKLQFVCHMSCAFGSLNTIQTELHGSGAMVFTQHLGYTSFGNVGSKKSVPCTGLLIQHSNTCQTNLSHRYLAKEVISAMDDSKHSGLNKCVDNSFAVHYDLCNFKA